MSSKEKIPFLVEVRFEWPNGDSIRLQELEIVATSPEEAERLALEFTKVDLVATANPAKTWLAE